MSKTNSITIHNIDKVLEFLSIFEDPNIQLYTCPPDAVQREEGCVVVDVGHVYEYSQRFYDFIDALQANGLFIPYSEEVEARSANIDIEKAELRTLLQLITYHIRGERLCIPSVLVKLIEVPRDEKMNHEQYTQFITSVVSATNWQNSIKQSDLKANDIEQVRIERELRKRNYFYVRKRQTKREIHKTRGVKSKLILQRDVLAVAIASCLLDPERLRLGKERLFEDETYKTIFNGKPVSIYLAQHWLFVMIKRVTAGDRRKGYARPLAIRCIWNELSSFFSSARARDAFIYLAEHNMKTEIKPVQMAAKTLLVEVMAYYKINRRSENTFMDESTFFKKKGIYKDFSAHWASRKAARRRKRFRRSIEVFKKNVREVEGWLER